MNIEEYGEHEHVDRQDHEAVNCYVKLGYMAGGAALGAIGMLVWFHGLGWF